MIYLQRKLKMKFIGADDYLPEGVPRGKWIPVIGFEVRRREQQKQNEQGTKIVEDIYYVITNDKGKVVSVASFNCSTMIDENAEWNTSQAMQLISNLTVLAKVLSEKLSKTDSKGTTETDT